jgi:hypothetical protein
MSTCPMRTPASRVPVAGAEHDAAESQPADAEAQGPGQEDRQLGVVLHRIPDPMPHIGQATPDVMVRPARNSCSPHGSPDAAAAPLPDRSPHPSASRRWRSPQSSHRRKLPWQRGKQRRDRWQSLRCNHIDVRGSRRRRDLGDRGATNRCDPLVRGTGDALGPDVDQHIRCRVGTPRQQQDDRYHGHGQVAHPPPAVGRPSGRCVPVAGEHQRAGNDQRQDIRREQHRRTEGERRPPLTETDTRDCQRRPPAKSRSPPPAAHCSRRAGTSRSRRPGRSPPRRPDRPAGVPCVQRSAHLPMRSTLLGSSNAAAITPTPITATTPRATNQAEEISSRRCAVTIPSAMPCPLGTETCRVVPSRPEPDSDGRGRRSPRRRRSGFAADLVEWASVPAVIRNGSRTATINLEQDVLGQLFPGAMKAVGGAQTHGGGSGRSACSLPRTELCKPGVEMRLEGKVEPISRPDSCDSRPTRSALDAVATCRCGRAPPGRRWRAAWRPMYYGDWRSR